MTQLRPMADVGPDYREVLTDDNDFLGDVDREADGTWTADTSCGFAAPQRGFATRDEAVDYVVGG